MLIDFQEDKGKRSRENRENKINPGLRRSVEVCIWSIRD